MQISEGKAFKNKNLILKINIIMKTKRSNYRKCFALAYVLLVAVLFIGCKKGERLPRIVESKSYSSDEYGNKLPKGICTFYYKAYENDSFYNSTQENCDCYKVGDTLK